MIVVGELRIKHLNDHFPVLQLYTFLSVFLFIFFLPIIALISVIRKKYRGRTLQRLGLTLKNQLPSEGDDNIPVIWIHALSVGEVTSALPLIQGIRHRYPEVRLYFSTTTSTGQTTAKQLTEGLVDGVFFSPFDVSFAVQRFIHLLNPSLFILVETDFWPGWLYTLRKNKIPCLLVNGRFSAKSLHTYRRFGFLFQPMFKCFTRLSMQTKQDAEALQDMGLANEKVITLGNLKYDSSLPESPLHNKKISRQELGFSDNTPLLICGSTHKGEEEIIFKAFKEIKKQSPELCLLLAPRDINRADEIEGLAQKYELQIKRRSKESKKSADILLLDTLGELAFCYGLADIALIGGSLVPTGGHNPLEAATFGIPILFGPHMEDFAEISRDLVTADGALIVTSSDELAKATLSLLNTPAQSIKMGDAAKKIIIKNKGVVQRHLEVIDQLLKE